MCCRDNWARAARRRLLAVEPSRVASALAMLIGLGLRYDRVDLAAGIDSADLQDVTAVEPEPTAIQRIKTAALSSEESDGGDNPTTTTTVRTMRRPRRPSRLGGPLLARPLLLLGLAHCPNRDAATPVDHNTRAPLSGRPLHDITLVLTQLLTRVFVAHLLDLLQDLNEVVGLRSLQRRELNEGLELLQPQLLPDGQHVPVVDVRGARRGQCAADGQSRTSGRRPRPARTDRAGCSGPGPSHIAGDPRARRHRSSLPS